MKWFLHHVAPKIWTRLFLLIVAAILLTWAVVGIAFYWLDSAQKVVAGLGENQVPRLMLTTELSAKAAELAILSNRILYSQQTDPEELETALRGSVAELIQLLDTSFDTPLTQADATGLQNRLAAIIHTLDRTREIEKQKRRKLESLRWLNVDMQDESTALVADFAYNIEALTRKLTLEVDPRKRGLLAQTLLEEQALHANFLGSGNETSITTTLAAQISTSQSPEHLAQLERLFTDALERINNRLTELPEKPEYLFLRQSTRALNVLTIGTDGAISDQIEWQASRGKLKDHLDQVFTQLSDMQAKLGDQAGKHRNEFIAISTDFTANSILTMWVLLAMTALAAIGGLTILFLYVRPSIIRPMQSLTTAMHLIAVGETPKLEGMSKRGDEISQLAEAVHVFRTSVQERDQAIEKLRQTQSELVQVGKMAALGTLSAGISHELNQPLGAIRQRLHLADKALSRDEKNIVLNQVKKIDELVTRMERIIDHLRRFARRSEYNCDEVLLAPLVADASELLAAKMTTNNITLHTQPDMAGMKFLGDSLLVEQVLVNLISNSIDAIVEKGEPGKIILRPERAMPGQMSFSVLDTGTGLGDLTPKQAIDPFVTTKEPGQGLGLGLSISFNIVTGMGGSLHLAHRDLGGTRVTITLPRP